MLSNRNRRGKKRAVSVLICLILFAIGAGVMGYWRRAPTVQTFSGPIRDGDNAYGVRGMYQRTIDFSPDAQSVAYIWSDTSYIHTRESQGRPLTLTEALEIRVRPTATGQNELRIPLDSIDFRPNGVLYYSLDASLQMAPDSRHLAALCARRLVILDIVAMTNSRVEYAGELFGTFAWLDSKMLTFSTCDGGGVLTFWQYKVGSSLDSRVKIYAGPALPETVEGRLPALHHNLHMITFGKESRKSIILQTSLSTLGDTSLGRFVRMRSP